MNPRYAMNYFYYLSGEVPVRIRARSRPSEKNKNKITGTWSIQEFNGEKWVMPVFPEITMLGIGSLKFIGKEVIDMQRGIV